jgi:hypothetical protein
MPESQQQPMPESQQQPKKPDSARVMQITVGILCFLWFVSGLNKVFTTSQSESRLDQTISLVLGVVQMVSGGIGVAVTGWLVLRKRT